jgi:anti-sigma regulatory factor (Ser/Thr protein kinase)
MLLSSELEQAVSWSFDLACALDQVPGSAQRLIRFLSQQGCDPDTCAACQLAFVEGCNNAIQYVRPESRLEPIMVEVECGPDAVELRIKDYTPGFDWPASLSLPGAEQEHGRGLFLIAALMDEASYSRGPDGNILVLRKKRPSR